VSLVAQEGFILGMHDIIATATELRYKGLKCNNQHHPIMKKMMSIYLANKIKSSKSSHIFTFLQYRLYQGSFTVIT